MLYTVSMEQKKFHYWRLLILVFAISAAVPVLSAGCIVSYGMFGEIGSSAVVEEAEEECALAFSRISVRKKCKNRNIYNIWLILWVIVVCIRLLACEYKLPGEDTLVARKVRLDA